MMPCHFTQLNEVTIVIDGQVHASEHYLDWPYSNGGEPFMPIQEDGLLQLSTSYHHFWYFNLSNFLTFTGNGSIDGHGYMWWWREIMVTRQHNRPNLVQIEKTKYLKIEGVSFLNSPRYHIVPHEVINAEFYDFEIYCDIVG